MFKKVEKSVSIIKTDMESIKVTQINFKRLKNTVSEMKNIQCLDGIKSRLHKADKKSNELEDTVTEATQTQTQEKDQKEMNRASASWRMGTEHPEEKGEENRKKCLKK